MAKQKFHAGDDETERTLVAPAYNPLATRMEDSRPYLRIIQPRDQGNRYPISEHGLVLGRGTQVDVFLQDAQVSRRHCKIRQTGVGIVVEDLGSTNGTLIDGVPVKQRVLAPADRLKVGGFVMRVEYRAQIEIKEEQQLQAAALSDELTGLHNRRWFFVESAKRLVECARTRQHISMVMIDIDRFKQVNDNYGHAAGDYVLCQVARLLRAQIRTVDLLARFGGEEFVMLLPNTSSTDAIVFCDRLCELIDQSKVQFGNKQIPVQISAGVWSRDAALVNSLEEAIGGADAAMYRAKRAGRNRVSD